jgi:hypothetical protein
MGMEERRGTPRLGRGCPAPQRDVSERSYPFHPHQSPFVLSGVGFRKSRCHGSGCANSNQVRLADGSYLRAPLGISRSTLLRRAAHRERCSFRQASGSNMARAPLIVIEALF